MTTTLSIPSLGRPAPLFRMARRGLVAAGVIAGVVLASAPLPALAQDLSTLAFRLDRLERDLNALSGQVYSGGAGAVGSPAGLNPTDIGALQVRLTELESLLQQATGQAERAAFEAQDLKRRFELFAEDTEARLIALESGGAATPRTSGAGVPPAQSFTPSPGAAPVAVAGAGSQPGQTGVLGYVPGTPQAAPAAGVAPQALLNGSPAEQYNYAFSLLRRADYVAAEQAFRSFLDANPSNGLSGNAAYWLGETYYIRGNYEQAAMTFLEGYKSYPDSNKAPDNLLKLGLSMAAINKTQEACAAFSRLSTQFPGAPEPIKRRARSEMQRVGCR
ncbi:MAG: tol-pal system protein YbgF [Rhodospirillaceae bacterium]